MSIAAAGVPVFLHPGCAGVYAEAAQLGPFAQAPLELGEAGEADQGRDVVPEPDGPSGPGSLLITGPKNAAPAGG